MEHGCAHFFGVGKGGGVGERGGEGGGEIVCVRFFNRYYSYLINLFK